MCASTVICFDQLDAEIKFYIVPGHWTELHGTYINQADGDQEKQDTLTMLMYHPETGETIAHEIDISRLRQEMIVGDPFIVCGVYP